MITLAIITNIIGIVFCAAVIACSKEHNQELKQWVLMLKSKGGSK